LVGFEHALQAVDSVLVHVGQRGVVLGSCAVLQRGAAGLLDLACNVLAVGGAAKKVKHGFSLDDHVVVKYSTAAQASAIEIAVARR